eukprot:sb/3460383/
MVNEMIAEMDQDGHSSAEIDYSDNEAPDNDGDHGDGRRRQWTGVESVTSSCTFYSDVESHYSTVDEDFASACEDAATSEDDALSHVGKMRSDSLSSDISQSGLFSDDHSSPVVSQVCLDQTIVDPAELDDELSEDPAELDDQLSEDAVENDGDLSEDLAGFDTRYSELSVDSCSAKYEDEEGNFEEDLSKGADTKLDVEGDQDLKSDDGASDVEEILSGTLIVDVSGDSSHDAVEGMSVSSGSISGSRDLTVLSTWSIACTPPPSVTCSTQSLHLEEPPAPVKETLIEPVSEKEDDVDESENLESDRENVNTSTSSADKPLSSELFSDYGGSVASLLMEDPRTDVDTYYTSPDEKEEHVVTMVTDIDLKLTPSSRSPSPSNVSDELDTPVNHVSLPSPQEVPETPLSEDMIPPENSSPSSSAPSESYPLLEVESVSISLINSREISPTEEDIPSCEGENVVEVESDDRVVLNTQIDDEDQESDKYVSEGLVESDRESLTDAVEGMSVSSGSGSRDLTVLSTWSIACTVTPPSITCSTQSLHLKEQTLVEPVSETEVNVEEFEVISPSEDLLAEGDNLDDPEFADRPFSELYGSVASLLMEDPRTDVDTYYTSPDEKEDHVVTMVTDIDLKLTPSPDDVEISSLSLRLPDSFSPVLSEDSSLTLPNKLVDELDITEVCNKSPSPASGDDALNFSDECDTPRGTTEDNLQPDAKSDAGTSSACSSEITTPSPSLMTTETSEVSVEKCSSSPEEEPGLGFETIDDAESVEMIPEIMELAITEEGDVAPLTDFSELYGSVASLLMEDPRTDVDTYYTSPDEKEEHVVTMVTDIDLKLTPSSRSPSPSYSNVSDELDTPITHVSLPSPEEVQETTPSEDLVPPEHSSPSSSAPLESYPSLEVENVSSGSCDVTLSTWSITCTPPPSVTCCSYLESVSPTISREISPTEEDIPSCEGENVVEVESDDRVVLNTQIDDEDQESEKEVSEVGLESDHNISDRSEGLVESDRERLTDAVEGMSVSCGSISGSCDLTVLSTWSIACTPPPSVTCSTQSLHLEEPPVKEALVEPSHVSDDDVRAMGSDLENVDAISDLADRPLSSELFSYYGGSVASLLMEDPRTDVDTYYTSPDEKDHDVTMVTDIDLRLTPSSRSLSPSYSNVSDELDTPINHVSLPSPEEVPETTPSEDMMSPEHSSPSSGAPSESYPSLEVESVSSESCDLNLSTWSITCTPPPSVTCCSSLEPVSLINSREISPTEEDIPSCEGENVVEVESDGRVVLVQEDESDKDVSEVGLESDLNISDRSEGLVESDRESLTDAVEGMSVSCGSISGSRDLTVLSTWSIACTPPPSITCSIQSLHLEESPTKETLVEPVSEKDDVVDSENLMSDQENVDASSSSGDRPLSSEFLSELYGSVASLLMEDPRTDVDTYYTSPDEKEEHVVTMVTDIDLKLTPSSRSLSPSYSNVSDELDTPINHVSLPTGIPDSFSPVPSQDRSLTSPNKLDDELDITEVCSNAPSLTLDDDALNFSNEGDTPRGTTEEDLQPEAKSDAGTSSAGSSEITTPSPSLMTTETSEVSVEKCPPTPCDEVLVEEEEPGLGFETTHDAESDEMVPEIMELAITEEGNVAPLTDFSGYAGSVASLLMEDPRTDVDTYYTSPDEKEEHVVTMVTDIDLKLTPSSRSPSPSNLSDDMGISDLISPSLPTTVSTSSLSETCSVSPTDSICISQSPVDLEPGELLEESTPEISISLSPAAATSPSLSTETSTSPIQSAETSTSPSQSTETSSSPSLSPETATSSSLSTETSTSPSQSPTRSISPSESLVSSSHGLDANSSKTEDTSPVTEEPSLSESAEASSADIEQSKDNEAEAPSTSLMSSIIVSKVEVLQSDVVEYGDKVHSSLRDISDHLSSDDEPHVFAEFYYTTADDDLVSAQEDTAAEEDDQSYFSRDTDNPSLDDAGISPNQDSPETENVAVIEEQSVTYQVGVEKEEEVGVERTVDVGSITDSHECNSPVDPLDEPNVLLSVQGDSPQESLSPSDASSEEGIVQPILEVSPQQSSDDEPPAAVVQDAEFYYTTADDDLVSAQEDTAAESQLDECEKEEVANTIILIHRLEIDSEDVQSEPSLIFEARETGVASEDSEGKDGDIMVQSGEGKPVGVEYIAGDESVVTPECEQGVTLETEQGVTPEIKQCATEQETEQNVSVSVDSLEDELNSMVTDDMPAVETENVAVLSHVPEVVPEQPQNVSAVDTPVLTSELYGSVASLLMEDPRTDVDTYYTSPDEKEDHVVTMVTDHSVTTTTTPELIPVPSDDNSEANSAGDEISPILASSPVPSETTEQIETLHVVTDEDISTEDSDALVILEDSICLTFNQPAIPEETEEEEDEIPESSGEVPGLGIEEIYLAESSGEWANMSTVEECVAVLDEDSICRTPDMSRSFCDDLPTSSRSRVAPLTPDHRSTSLTTVNLPGLGEVHVRSKSEQCIHGDQRSTHHSLDKILPATESSLPESFFSSTQDIGVFRSLENLQTPPRLKRLRKKRNSSSRHTHYSSSTSLDEDQAASPRRRSHKKESPITQPLQMSTPTRDIVSLSNNLQQEEESLDFSVLSNLSPLPSVVDRKKCSTPSRRRGSAGTPTTLTPSTPKTRPEVLRLGGQVEGIYFTKSTRSVEKVAMKLDSVLFGGGGGDSSDSDGEMERFEREIVRESYAAVMDQLKVMVPLNTGENDAVAGTPLPNVGCCRDDAGALSSADITGKGGPRVLITPDTSPVAEKVSVTLGIAEEDDPMLELDDNDVVSVSDILSGYDANTSLALLEERDATSSSLIEERGAANSSQFGEMNAASASSSQLVERDDGVERVGEIIQQQYFSQLMDEMRSWNPACELDGDPHPPTSTRARILSEPGSSSSSEPTINAFLRTLGGSDSEFSTPSTPCRFAAGLDPHPCSDSPFQKAQSLSVILKSPEIRKYQSKLRPCANPECGACQAKRKRKSERWKRWKILNQDQNPCQVD